MTATKGIEFEGRFFWAYDVAAGVFLKYLIDEAEASEQTDEPWLSEAMSHWRVELRSQSLDLPLKNSGQASRGRSS